MAPESRKNGVTALRRMDMSVHLTLLRSLERHIRTRFSLSETHSASKQALGAPDLLVLKSLSFRPRDVAFSPPFVYLMRFAYEDLSESQFEELVVLICRRLLGIGVQGFAKGPDGGRDAKFVGTAELYPSRSAPWTGTTIVQAKHTNGLNRSFAEPDFYSRNSANTVLGKELPRIKALRRKKQLDNYILFANRRLSGNSESDITEHISDVCNVPAGSVSLCGVEQIESWLKMFPDIANEAEIDPIDSPLIVSPDDLAEIVLAFSRQRESILTVVDDMPEPRVSYEEKNAANGMTAAYALALRKKYLKETALIRTFLAAPENVDLLGLYESVADEFELRIISRRNEFQSFDRIMEYLVDLLHGRDPVLRQYPHKRLTRLMLFYMYWNCDIGQVEHATTD